MKKTVDWTLTVLAGGSLGVMVVALIGIVSESSWSANQKVFANAAIVLFVSLMISFVLFVVDETRKRESTRPKR